MKIKRLIEEKDIRCDLSKVYVNVRFSDHPEIGARGFDLPLTSTGEDFDNGVISLIQDTKQIIVNTIAARERLASRLGEFEVEV